MCTTNCTFPKKRLVLTLKKTDWLHLAYFASNLHRFAFCHKYLYQLPSGRWTPSRSKPRPKISGQASFQFFQGIIISWDFLNNDARIIFDIAHDKLSYSTKAEKLPACTNVFEIKCNFSSSAPSRDRSRTACEGSPGVSKKLSCQEKAMTKICTEASILDDILLLDISFYVRIHTRFKWRFWSFWFYCIVAILIHVLIVIYSWLIHRNLSTKIFGLILDFCPRVRMFLSSSRKHPFLSRAHITLLHAIFFISRLIFLRWPYKKGSGKNRE